MRRYLKFVALLVLTSAVALAQTAPGKSPAPMPQIKQNGAVKQMFVDGKPFIMLAGELHNSSGSSTEYMKPIWDKLARMNVNTVIGTVSWELWSRRKTSTISPSWTRRSRKPERATCAWS